jgi:membrane protein implicated in regulation of membrane protease activity
MKEIFRSKDEFNKYMSQNSRWLTSVIALEILGFCLTVLAILIYLVIGLTSFWFSLILLIFGLICLIFGLTALLYLWRDKLKKEGKLIPKFKKNDKGSDTEIQETSINELAVTVDGEYSPIPPAEKDNVEL